MKILFYIHGITDGGAERVMTTLMNSFVQQGHRVRVVYTLEVTPPKYELDNQIEQVYLALNGPVVKNTITNKIHRHLWKFPAIRRAAKQYSPDVAVSFIRTNNNDVLFALLGTGIPVIIGDHTNVDRKYPKLTSLLSKFLYPHASAIIMLTMRDYNKWKDKYKQVYYLPNPCDLTTLKAGNRREKTVLAAGRVFQWEIKGFDNLIHAWYLIKDDFPEWKCLIAGKFDQTSIDRLKKVVSEEEINSVTFLGFRSDIHNLMASSEVFCLSSRFEGMPMALLEAMNLGCACVATDCVTGPSEMIVDGETGLLAKDNDVEDLAKKLKLVMADDTLRHSIQDKTPSSVERFSTPNIVNKWNELLNEVIK